jgi:phage/plasmid-associated DNA primase
LLTSVPGILNWSLAGLADWLERGLDEPDAVLDATDRYRAEEDRVSRFLDDSELIIDPRLVFEIEVLNRHLDDWVEETGERLSMRRVAEELTKRGAERDRAYVVAKRVRVWRGVGYSLDGTGGTG